MKNFSSLLLVILMSIFTLPFSINAQCPEMEETLEELVSQDIHPVIENKNYDIFEKTVCYSIKNVDADEFVVLGKGLEYSNLIKNDPSTVEYRILKATDWEKGYRCEHIFIKRNPNRKKNVPPKCTSLNQFNRVRKQNLLKAKRESLSALKKQQKYLTTDILNIFGGVLVAQIEVTPPLQDALEKSAEELKKLGITEVSKYYDIDYIPSQNETADLVRNILNPVDKILSSSGVPMGKWLKYWEALKLTPDAGMIIGNAGAKVRIYFMIKELEEEISQLEKEISEMP